MAQAGFHNSEKKSFIKQSKTKGAWGKAALSMVLKSTEFKGCFSRKKSSASLLQNKMFKNGLIDSVQSTTVCT